MYVHIFGYLVNKLEIWWVYLSPIEKKKDMTFKSLHKGVFSSSTRVGRQV